MKNKTENHGKNSAASRKKVLRGNLTAISPDEEIYPSYVTLSLTQKNAVAGDGKLPLTNHMNVAEAREFSKENQK
ncbi:MAG: hypothetical protein IJC94_09870 [Oscillospiraceae bacterium]|nr:hypothetical protein [Oscillospiraceae bacterium]